MVVDCISAQLGSGIVRTAHPSPAARVLDLATVVGGCQSDRQHAHTPGNFLTLHSL